jgi:cytochrome c-type biogenesis protein CcmH/NrfG
MAKTGPAKGHYVKRQTLTTSVVIALMVGFAAGLVYGVYKSGSQLPSGAPGVANPGNGRAGMLARLEERVRANPEDVEAWVQIGHINFDTQRHQAAIEAYEKALEINPANAPVLTDLGIMYRRSGQPEEAIRRFDEAIAVDPKLENPRFNKGIVLLHDLNDRDAAIATWEELLKVNPLAMAPNGQSVDKLITEFKSQP